MERLEIEISTQSEDGSLDTDAFDADAPTARRMLNERLDALIASAEDQDQITVTMFVTREEEEEDGR